MTKLQYFNDTYQLDDEGNKKALIVTLTTEMGGMLPVVLDVPDKELKRDEMFNLALESLFKDNYQERAKKEADEKQEALNKDFEKRIKALEAKVTDYEAFKKKVLQDMGGVNEATVDKNVEHEVEIEDPDAE